MRPIEVRSNWPLRSFKIIAASLSAGAALLSILSSAHNFGLNLPLPRSAGMEAPRVGWVGVSPMADTLRAVGDTLHLVATVGDEHGGILRTALPIWASSRAGVASVNSSGTVVARSAGTAIITVSVGGQAAQAEITVRPHTTGLRIVEGDTLRLPEAGQLRLTVRATDARDSPVLRPGVTWQSADTLIARVDGEGLVLGITPGRTTLTATVNAVSAQTILKVVAVPVAMTLLTGSDQHAPAGRVLPEPVVVQIVSRQGRPVPAVPVQFLVSAGGGTVEPRAELSDPDGRVRTQWTLGAAPGRHRLAIVAEGIDSALKVLAEADPVPANTRLKPSDGLDSARVGEVLPSPLTIRVTDSLGLALADLPVAWTALDGGSVLVTGARTDSTGQSQVRWTLGPKAGPQHARVQVGSARTMPPVTFTALALAGPAASLRAVSGDGQTGPAGKPLARPVVLRVTDSLGNPVAAARVAITSASGRVSDSVVTTDSAGFAGLRWTLGPTAGVQRLSAVVEGPVRPLGFSARATPLPPTKVVFLAPPAAATAGRPLARPLRLKVTDAYGNPIFDQAVVFSTRFGSVTPARVRTDREGVTEVRWTLGPTPGEQVLLASLAGTSARTTLTIHAGAAAKPAGKNSSPR